MAIKSLIPKQPYALLRCLAIFLAIFWSSSALASQESEILLARGNKYYLD